MDAFWKSLLFAGHETLFIPAASELVMHQRAIGRQISLDDYIAKRFDSPADNNAHGPASPFHWRRYTGVISVTLAVELGKLAATAPHGLRVRYARGLQLNELKQANAVLVGTADANPWVSLFRDRLNYHIDLDVPNDKILVRNDAPAAGERDVRIFRHRASNAWLRGAGLYPKPERQRPWVDDRRHLVGRHRGWHGFPAQPRTPARRIGQGSAARRQRAAV
ncbi:hypothetical protein [Janthinobacterium sp. PC23-8]|uniref:hypothetical protein n=1 Tax=Janthinobacterium sp. PC23-8 TaxID=2012679 RepID=UPI00113FD351|nr:hypothetical protein [Janthinobacterium sp. PC23-8]